jgi:hypothetical protein
VLRASATSLQEKREFCGELAYGAGAASRQSLLSLIGRRKHSPLAHAAQQARQARERKVLEAKFEPLVVVVRCDGLIEVLVNANHGRSAGSSNQLDKRSLVRRICGKRGRLAPERADSAIIDAHTPQPLLYSTVTEHAEQVAIGLSSTSQNRAQV